MELNEVIKKIHSIKEDYMETPGTSVLDTYHRHYPITIQEGLIKTYPTESVVVAMAQLFDLSGASNGYGGNGRIKISKRGEPEEKIIIVLDNGKANLFDKVNNHMLKYGWFLGEENKSYNGVTTLVFEKKFGDRYSVSDILKKGNDRYLYHITSSKIAEKIKKQGFVPKSNTGYLIADKEFRVQPEEANRLYFFIERPTDFEINSWGSMAVSRTKGEPVLITVDPEVIDKKVSFFLDPRWKKGVFTYEPIPPSAIVSIEKAEE